jgi:hypothetical protein
MLMLHESSRLDGMKKLADKRGQGGGEDKVLRIDYLGKNTMFKGLEKDEAYIKKRKCPGVKEFDEVWLVKCAAR